MYKYGKIEFEWDDLKAQKNFEKHGVLFFEAASSFEDEYGLTLLDHKHSKVEVRYYFIGRSTKNRILTTYYTNRAGRVRIIGSAEWRKFKRMYYERA